MKRPLALFCLCMLTALAVAYFLLGRGLSVAAAAICLVLFVLAIRAAKNSAGVKRAAVVLAALAVGFTVNFAALCAQQRTADAYCGRAVTLSGTLTDTQRVSEGCYLVDVSVSEVDGDSCRFSAAVYLRENCRAGDGICCTVRLEPTDSAELRGSSAQNVVIRTGKRPLLSAIHKIGSSMAALLYRTLPGDEGVLAAAMTLGERGEMSYALYDVFVRSGAVHILVLSGLHISIMCFVVQKLLERCGAPPWLKALFALATVSFFIVLCGPTPSLLRVAIMQLIMCAAQLSGRPSDTATTLSFAAALIALVDRAALGNAGFWLTFACTAVLTTAVPALSALLGKRRPFAGRRRLLQLTMLMLTPLLLAAATVPICMAFALPVSLVAPLSNLLVVWMVPAAIVLCLLLVVCTLLLPMSGLFHVIHIAATLACRYIIKMCSLLAAVPHAAVDLSAVPFRLFLLAAVLLLLVWAALGRGRLKWYWLSAPLLACALVLTLLFWRPGGHTVTVISANSGNSLIVGSGEDSALLFWGRSEYELYRAVSYAQRHGTQTFLFAADINCDSAAFDSYFERNCNAEYVMSQSRLSDADFPHGYYVGSGGFYVRAYIQDGSYQYITLLSGDFSLIYVIDSQTVPSGGNYDIIIMADAGALSAPKTLARAQTVAAGSGSTVIHVYEDGTYKVS